MEVTQLAGARVLIVEDEELVARVSAEVLELQGLVPEVVSTVAAALEALEREPALVLLDKNLPDGNGLDVLRATRRRWPFAETILYTGFPSFDSVLEALRLGAFDYLVKPLPSLEDLRHKTRRALERRMLLLERERTLRELQEAQRLQAMAAHSQMMAELGKMLSGIVHEVRSPLTYVQGNIEFVLERLQGGEDLAESEQALRDAFTGAQRIGELLTQIRRVSSVKAFHSEERGLVLVQDLVATTLALTRAEVQQHATVELELVGEPLILGSAGRLTQVLVNLVVNAAQALPLHGDGKVTIRSSASTGRVCIEVEDSGPGISPELAARIFEPFFSTKEVGEGTGLGLAVAREIAQEHGGTLKLVAGRGTGACFSLELPEAKGA